VKALRLDAFEGTARFRVLRRIGAGGMGVVYEAFDRDTGSQVALKTLRAPNAESLLRFKREFRAVHDIQHPNLVQLGELVEEGGVWFFTMELVRGEQLLTYVRGDAVRDISPSAYTVDAMPSADLGADPYGARPALPRPAPVAARFDEDRVRRSMAQLAGALAAMHDGGIVHRDVKPGNVLVTAGGRVVLLDFGLALDLDGGQSLSSHIVGTANYMAPEQAAARTVGPEADWYSVGVVLYEALVGEPPFEGNQLEVMLAKQRSEAPRPSQAVIGVPPDLDQLCHDLLRFEPAERPTGRAVLARLGASPRPSLAATMSSVSTPPFVGRDDELAALHRAFLETREGRAAAVYLHGESGIGKTALVRRFTDQTVADHGAAVLAGRCYEREAVPFRAFDGVVDALALHLQRLPADRAAVLLPRRASLLLQVFPVLRRVDVFADAPRAEVSDPQELRTRVFDALRDLLTRLAERQPLIVVIDDLQWADADSIALLRELLRPPEAPPLLLLATWREVEGGAGTGAAIAGLPGEARHIALRSLPPDAARQLAVHVLATAGVPVVAADAIAAEASGHPLFIDELARFVAVRQGAVASHLDDVLWARISALEPHVRRLVELLAVAGSPLDQSVVAEAAGMSIGDFTRCAAQLRVQNLARTTGARRSDRIEPYHDRVRAAVLANLAPAVRQAHHRDLARALERGDRIDGEALAIHFRGAGELEKAAGYAAEAATRAAQALAFDRAVDLFRLALELSAPVGGDAQVRRDVRSLQVQLGDALAHAGRGAEAAVAYLAVAAQASSAEALDLRRRAAQQYLLSGHIDEGVGVLGSVLAAEGIGFPTTPRRALLGVVTRRALLGVRGHRFKARDEGEITSRELARIDACWHAGIALSTADTIRGTAFMTRCLLLALRAGEPYRIARALSVEAALISVGGIPAEAHRDRLLATAEALARQVDSPHALALVDGSRAQGHYLCGRFAQALALCQAAEAILRERCTGVSWETNTMRQWAARSLYLMGRLGELARRVPAYLDEAAARGDLYGDVNLRTSITPLLLLAADQPDAAEAEVIAAEARWSPAGFHVQHNYALHTRVGAALYRGDSAAALALAEQLRAGVARSLLSRIQMVRVTTADAMGRAAVAAVAAGDRGALAIARKAIRRLGAEATPMSLPMAALLAAGLAAVADAPDQAARHLEVAIDGFERADMAQHAAVARRRLGQLTGGETGSALIAAADAWLAAEDVVSPARTASMLAPGFPAG
jgi:serine/threonine protein kinase/tetratricopeptide (TPR) repeat protein